MIFPLAFFLLYLLGQYLVSGQEGPNQAQEMSVPKETCFATSEFLPKGVAEPVGPSLPSLPGILANKF